MMKKYFEEKSKDVKEVDEHRVRELRLEVEKEIKKLYGENIDLYHVGDGFYCNGVRRGYSAAEMAKALLE